MIDPVSAAWNEVLRLQEKLRASPEWQLVQRIECFDRSLRLLENNAAELRRAMRFLTNDKFRRPDDKRFKRWFDELERRLHNFAAASKTLYEHTQALSGELYGETGICPEHKERKLRLARTPVVPFVHKLRDLFLHRSVPTIVHLSTTRGREHTRHIALLREELLSWDGWNPIARTLIEQSPTHIDLAPIVDDYLATVGEFHAWFEDQLMNRHVAEHAVVRDKQAAIDRASARFHELATTRAR